MQNATAMLHCSNPLCQTPNSEDNKFCQKCRTPLLRRYLWVVGSDVAAYQPGEIVVDRYLCKDSRIFLDTKPGLLSANSAEVPERFLAYLRLTPWQLHVPQIYDWVQLDVSPDAVILLLDQVPLYAPTSSVAPGSSVEHDADATQPKVSSGRIQPFPTLSEAWQSATPLRQLNWLWQMANLWQPFSNEQVTASLLEPELLRVEGSLLRLMELNFEGTKTTVAPLAALGQLWSQWVPAASPAIAVSLQKICQQLIQGQIHNAELLLGYLDEAIALISHSQTRQIQIATRTDQGPTRQRNEDACYPRSGTVQTIVSPDAPLVIVCDGIGGHQGGDVASNLAIETVEQRVRLLTPASLDPTTLTVELEKAVCVANDQISQRNDNEQRYDRQRMGTTVVMGLVRDHELYIAHVGDSRAYWITQWGCHQVTLDDDVASREVRLGYSFYRQALQQPGSGSLVQALGMGASTMLYPTVQRFILDEDSIFLLCSDGLSDNDRIEECWETEILPLLNGQVIGQMNLATISQRLIEIGNTRNGYDNVTVGLIYCQVANTQSVLPPSEPAFEPSSAALSITQPVTQPRVTQPSAAQPSAAQPVGEAVSAGDTAIVSTSYSSQENIPSSQENIPSSQENIPSIQENIPSQAVDDPHETIPSTLKTQILQRRSQPSLPGLILGIVILLGIGGLLTYWLFPFASRQATLPLTQSSSPSPELPSPIDSTPPSPLLSLKAGSWIQLRQTTTQGGSGQGGSGRISSPVLLSRPEQPAPYQTASGLPRENASQIVGVLPVGSLLEVLEKQGETQQEQWVRLRVCTPSARTPSAEANSEDPSPQSSGQTGVARSNGKSSEVAPGGELQPEAPKSVPPPAETVPASPKAPGSVFPPLLQPGQTGWIREAELLPLVVSSRLAPNQKGVCASSATPTSLNFKAAATVSTRVL